jgi:hypothetical protein
MQFPAKILVELLPFPINHLQDSSGCFSSNFQSTISRSAENFVISCVVISPSRSFSVGCSSMDRVEVGVRVGRGVVVGGIGVGLTAAGTGVGAGAHPVNKAVRNTKVRKTAPIDFLMTLSPFDLIAQSCAQRWASAPPRARRWPHAVLGVFMPSRKPGFQEFDSLHADQPYTFRTMTVNTCQCLGPLAA